MTLCRDIRRSSGDMPSSELQSAGKGTSTERPEHGQEQARALRSELVWGIRLSGPKVHVAISVIVSRIAPYETHCKPP